MTGLGKIGDKCRILLQENSEPVEILLVKSPLQFKITLKNNLKHLLPFSEYKIHTYDEIETILLENGLK